MSAPRARHKFRALPAFNLGQPLTFVHVPGDFEGDPDQVGVVDADTMRVWFGHDVRATHVDDVRRLPRVDVPAFPKEYGKWIVKPIGGVSKTVRRVDTTIAKPKARVPITLFATRAPTADAVACALRDSEVAATGDAMYDPEHGHVTEVIVFDSWDVAHAAAVVSRAGAVPVLEDPNVHSGRVLGVERLDRIECASTTRDEDDEDMWGLRRGAENWRFPWLPDGWEVPLTWDHMVHNVRGVNDVATLPQPLRQHVCRARLAHATTDAERARLQRHIPSKRLVSAGLTVAQSKQVITLFHTLIIERAQGPVAEACRLGLFRYMLQVGYTGRILGPYKQSGLYTGNGDSFRHFARLTQYAPHRLPASVLNKLCTRDGTVRTRGSKGSRSKYIAKAQRWRPKRRLVRTEEDEAQMRA